MGKIIGLGWLCVNLPISLLFVAAAYMAYSLGYNFRLGVLIAFIPCWVYWSFTIPLWRKWALSQCKDEAKLEKYGRMFLLTFKKGSFFSKTEYRYKDK